MSTQRTLDLATEEIIRSSVVAITDEMKANLMRTAYNPIIYEALDYTVGLFDAEGNTISIGLGLPMFIRGLSDAIKAKLAFYGHNNIHPGDILLTNDAYIMGSHLNHLVFTLPIFHEGEIVGFSSSMAHWQDIGGVLGGKTQDIFSEGLQLPIVKIFKQGVQDREITDIICANVRLPDLAMGDLRAQVAAIRTGERRYHELLSRYGVRVVNESITAMYKRSEALARDAVTGMPDGTYTAEAFMDDDGVSDDPIPIRVTIHIAGDDMTIDLSEVSEQVIGYFNSGETAGHSAAEVAFKCLTTPTIYPINEGAFRPLSVVLPPGRVISAVKPAAMRWWMTIPMTVVDTIFRALAPAIPERVAAGHHADLCCPTIFGTDSSTGKFFLGFVSIPGGGWGGRHNSDGMSATVCINDGDTHNAPVEATEARLPVVIESYGLRQDSAGAGRFRGGLGVEQRIRVRTAARVNTRVDRTKCAPWGIEGGDDAVPNAVHIIRADGSEYRHKNGKLDAVALAEGDVLVVETGGGGGFGNPFERPAELVQRDVRNGYVSTEAAATEYGVRFDASGEVDARATERLRDAHPPLDEVRP